MLQYLFKIHSFILFIYYSFILCFCTKLHMVGHKTVAFTIVACVNKKEKKTEQKLQYYGITVNITVDTNGHLCLNSKQKITT